MKDLDTKKLLYRVSAEVVNIAKAKAPKDTGNLYEDINVLAIGELSSEIGNTRLAPYAKYVHGGTGLYGAKKKKIVPKKGKALKTPFGYRKSVKGMRAQPYLSDALEDYKTSGLDKALAAFGKDSSADIMKEIKKGWK